MTEKTWQELHDEMAEQLAAAQAENAHLRDERDLHDAVAAINKEEVERLQAENEALRASRLSWQDRAVRVERENARLRAALQSIAQNTYCDRCQEAALVAQAALTGGEKGGETIRAPKLNLTAASTYPTR